MEIFHKSQQQFESQRVSVVCGCDLKNYPGKRPQTVWGGAKGYEMSGGGDDDDDDDDDDTQMRTQEERTYEST